MNPRTIPIKGARTMKLSVFIQPAAIITPNPPLTIAAPAYPPIKACDELLGSPRYHVIKFQSIAPQTPASTTVGVIVFTSIIPFPIVLATVVPKIRKAMKLKNAAQKTACWGLRTLVDTMVATEFAASCMPLVKSKANASAIMKTIKIILDSNYEYYIVLQS